MDVKRRLLRTAILAMIGLVIGGAIAYTQIISEQNSAAETASTSGSMAGVSLGGPFELIDHNGDSVTQANYDGQYKLIYFGFTYCPAICPTELQKITQVLNNLDEQMAVQIQPLFISVDPERDTPDVMREYVSLFHPRFIGLTGSPEQIEAVKQDYKIFATKVQDENMSDYTVDHSSFIYLMSPDNKPLSIYRIKDDAAFIEADIRKIIEAQS